MNKRIGAMVGVAALVGSGAAIAACSSSGPATLTLNGTTTNVSSPTPTVPVTASGALSDHGTLPLAGNGSNGKSVIALGKGNLDVSHSNPKPVNSVSGETVTQVEKGTYTVTGGTGSYKGATGHGDFKVSFALTFAPGTTPAQMQNAQPTSGVVTFHASGPLTP